MNFVFLITGLLFVFLMGYIFSYDRKGIQIRPIIMMLLAQLVLSFFILNTTIGLSIIGGVSKLFETLMGYGVEGVNFVFGGMENEPGSVFFLNVLLPIVFISILIGILNYIKVLPFIIKYIGLGMSKLNGMGKLENYIAVSSALFGQSEVFLTTKEQLGKISKQRLYTLCTSAMSAVSVSVIGAYMTMLDPKYVVVGIIVNIFSALIVANLLNPYKLKSEEDYTVVSENAEHKEKESFFQMISESVMDGFKVAIIVGAMLIGFIALMTMINNLFDLVFHISFQDILGYVFAPIAFIIGIPWSEAVAAGGIMATKLVTNEFVAILSFKDMAGNLSDKTIAIVSVFLVSFANFSSIGIITGAVKALHDKKGSEVASFGLKLLFGSTLASILSATLVGLFI
ncbi:NupC/NupG family nucleoside CNT transporter [Viridibacillus sp. YIM B01967]|uniref:NupC/NupG family nucleoside CNT transporter n=1 Tax=Viridibacillus soli TaxID=2798301 RepID=A0ABS1H249_9BACL|nr:nucleoside transporter C-terminal domain-containing protein [Viridibacillus soli]MBK3493483.1 NupC/NupG family nucleoside CNT transporter [Viridibacillus soli]